MVANFADFVGKTNTEDLGARGRFTSPIISSNGSRDSFRYKIVSYVHGSDHWIFNDSALGVPMVAHTVWPYSHYHTNQDTPDKCDPTTLKRGAFITAALAIYASGASTQDTLPLAGEVLWRGLKRISLDLQKGLGYLNIRNLVSAEYKPVPLVEIKEFLEVLARAEIFKLK